MITGVVNAALEATISVRVRHARGSEQVVQAVIDTGFDGWLTLPPDVVAGLALPRRGRERGVLADGSVTFFRLYEATVIWDGQPRPVLVAVANGTPLVGMSLLERYELTIRVVDRGYVRITSLAAPQA